MGFFDELTNNIGDMVSGAGEQFGGQAEELRNGIEEGLSNLTQGDGTDGSSSDDQQE